MCVCVRTCVCVHVCAHVRMCVCVHVVHTGTHPHTGLLGHRKHSQCLWCDQVGYKAQTHLVGDCSHQEPGDEGSAVQMRAWLRT